MTNWWKIRPISQFKGNDESKDDSTIKITKYLNDNIIFIPSSVKDRPQKGDYVFLWYRDSVKKLVKITDEWKTDVAEDVEKYGLSKTNCVKAVFQSISDDLEIKDRWDTVNWITIDDTPTARPDNVIRITEDDMERFEQLVLKRYFGTSSQSVIDNDKSFDPNHVEMILPKLNTILYGPPGTGKTFLLPAYAVAICSENVIKKIEGNHKDFVKFASEMKKADRKKVKDEYKRLRDEEGRIEFVTFHQSYGYEDFIGGIKPDVKKESIKYKLQAGVFKRFCDKARGKEENYVFIIDEINRGNISKIFGELITLIEESKREKKPDETSLTLSYAEENKYSFSVPSNVYILGAMNTADRSIALMDTALRRRFDFVEMMPRPEIFGKEDKNPLEVAGVNIPKMLRIMNERIEYLYDREHTIGHAYFYPLKEKANLDVLADIFRNKIIPLLQEYFYEDYGKIQLVLGDAYKEQKFQFISIKKDSTKEKLFAFNRPKKDQSKELQNLLADVDDKNITYEINDGSKENKDDVNNAFNKPQSYIQIYQYPTAGQN